MSVNPSFNSAPIAPSTSRSIAQRLERGLTGALLTLALGLTATGPLAAQSLPRSPMRASVMQLAANSDSYRPLPDGVYLYGRSPKANQIGTAYMVFKVSQRQVVGAFYMPSSSFDCFRGEQEAERLSLTIADSYEQTRYPYSVALQSTATVAGAAQVGIPAAVPAGFHAIKTISRNDYRLLATCQASR